MRVAIVGAGVGGLTLGALLAKAGYGISLFDQFDTPRPVGSGLMIQPVGLAVMDLIGAGDAARLQGQRIRRMLGLEARTGQRVLDVAYAPEGASPERHGLAIHRAGLHGALLNAARKEGLAIVTARKIIGTELQDGQRWISSQDESYGPFDLIVDASGARSSLSPLTARPLPYGAIWGTVPWPAGNPMPIDQLSQRYRRADRMAGILPLGTVPGRDGTHAAVFWSLPIDRLADWHRDGLDRWKREAITLWPEMAPFLNGITDPAQMTPARYSHGSLRHPWAERIAYIGDAAHRASPQLGQGANMALLDALALARALQHHPLDDALPAYGQMRRWHLRLYQFLSAAFTPQYQSGSPILPVLRDWLLAPVSMVPPLPWILSRLVAGKLLPPLAGEVLDIPG
ncbi:MAG: FAD-dependent oxidoreductase [Pseudorhodobacter sp.]